MHHAIPPAADRDLGRAQQRDGLLLLAHRVAFGVMRAHIAERGRVGFLEPLVGGAALPARRVPRGLLGGGELVGETFEVRTGARMRVDRREDRIGLGPQPGWSASEIRGGDAAASGSAGMESAVVGSASAATSARRVIERGSALDMGNLHVRGQSRSRVPARGRLADVVMNERGRTDPTSYYS